MTEKLNQRKIVLIALLKSKGINDKRIISQVLKSSKRGLNLIHAKHIKHTRINDKAFFKHLLKPRSFSKDFLLVEKIEIICTEIDNRILKRYYNNKSNVLFQEFIDFLLDYLLTFKSTHLSFDLYTHIKDNYKIENKTNVVRETLKAGKYTLEQLKLVNELIDHIDYINYLNNDITKLQRLRMKSSFDFNGYTIDLINDVEKFANENKDLKSIYNRLKFTEGKLENKLLYNELTQLKQNLHETLYTINYGITTSDSASSKNKANISNELSTGVMPFYESGALELTDKQFNQLHINTIFCNKLNTKFIKALKNGRYNNHSIDGSLTIISEGKNRYNKGKFNKSYFIHYQYNTTIEQEKSFKRLLKNLEISCKNNAKYNDYDNFKDFIRCTYNFPYYNQRDNFKTFKQHFKDNVKSNLNVKYSYVYPYAIKQSSLQKKKFLSFISWNNNIWKDYSFRSHINNDLANIIYNLDLNRLISDFYNPKNQLLFTYRKQRIFLRHLMIEINKTYSIRFNKFLYNLIKETNDRIYLFETYGIKALVNQIRDLKQFHDSFKAKRSLKAIRTKHLIKRLTELIPLRKQHLEVLKWVNQTLENNLKAFNPSSVLIQSILHQNIQLYLRKTIIRKIDISRPPKELVLMACNNLKSINVDFMDTMPIHIKTESTGLTKFDEILDCNDNYKIEYIDKETKINIIALFKAITKFDRYFDLNDLYKVILNSNINEKTKLKDYIYKEKYILNT